MKSYNGFTPEQREYGDSIVKKAIERGDLKPLSEAVCCLCGQDKGIRHYHQEDYSPDKVVADSHCLCWRCHMMLHSRYKHPESFAKYMIDVTIYHKRFAPVFRHDFDLLNEHLID